MQAVKSTYVKALMLLVVFSMNTLVSFACSFSSVFHGAHHHGGSASKAHKHSGNHHTHGKSHQHGAEKPHHHSDGKKHDHHPSAPDGEKGEDCCSMSVVKIEKWDKAAAKTIEAPQAQSVAAIVSTYFYLITPFTVQKLVYPPHLRWRHPATIQDLRIVIQSFLI